MLFLTDQGPVNCDDERHEVRDLRTGNPRPLPPDDDDRIRTMVRRWLASKRRQAHDSRSTSRQDTKMRSRFNPNALMQRNDSRDGEAFAEYVAERKLSPLEFWQKKLRDASRAARGHAFDSAGDHEEALKHLQRMQTHIEVRGGTPEFDPIYMAKCFANALAAMGSPEADAEEDAEDEQEYSAGAPIPSERAKAKDRAGEVPARSVVTTSGERREVDHRRDFNDQGGGADSAHGFDANHLFQRGGDR